MKLRWLARLCSWIRDPFGVKSSIDKDWNDFRAMSDAQLSLEFDTLLDEKPLSDRFRRICQFLALR